MYEKYVMRLLSFFTPFFFGLGYKDMASPYPYVARAFIGHRLDARMRTLSVRIACIVAGESSLIFSPFDPVVRSHLLCRVHHGLRARGCSMLT